MHKSRGYILNIDDKTLAILTGVKELRGLKNIKMLFISDYDKMIFIYDFIYVATDQ